MRRKRCKKRPWLPSGGRLLWCVGETPKRGRAVAATLPKKNLAHSGKSVGSSWQISWLIREISWLVCLDEPARFFEAPRRPFFSREENIFPREGVCFSTRGRYFGVGRAVSAGWRSGGDFESETETDGRQGGGQTRKENHFSAAVLAKYRTFVIAYYMLFCC